MNLVKILMENIDKENLENALRKLEPIYTSYTIKNNCGDTSKELEYVLSIYNLRKKDIPAELDDNGNKYWRNDKGQRHRDDGPAIEYTNGGKEWYLNGKRHRIDGPAIEYTNGGKEWYLNGKRHRIDGPAIEKYNGDKAWYIHGKLHRIDGPAFEDANGTKYWYFNGKLHGWSCH